MRWISLFTVLALTGVLSGCALKQPESVFREGPRMLELYRGTADTVTPPENTGQRVEPGPPAPRLQPLCGWWIFARPCRSAQARRPDEEPHEPTYSRSAANELRFLFPRLPNPDIYIYVLPHLATEARVPVPGYTTAVPLYERVEYALPGELDGLPSGNAGEPSQREADDAAVRVEGRLPEAAAPAGEVTP